MQKIFLDVRCIHRKDDSKVRYFHEKLANDREYMMKHDYEIDDPAFILEMDRRKQVPVLTPKQQLEQENENLKAEIGEETKKVTKKTKK